ncbi:MAG TPA: DUF1365 domain-containing protein [Microvirga sp.]|nr:DUF1365 domain-containing protein [Microvirga sp.]
MSLYRGEVFHARLRPVPHRFRYRVFSILIDLDRLGEAHRAARVFSVNQPNLLSFHERDYGPRDGTSLRAHVRNVLRACGHGFAVGRILLLAYPRCLGFVFNPLAVYFVFGTDGTLRAVLYEVRNTFGEMHAYPCPVEPGALTPAGLRQRVRKAFHVSPFLAMEARYEFRLAPPPADRLRLHVLESGPDGPVLAAGFTARRWDLTSRTALAALAAMPLMTFKVVAAIHWEALRLWFKNVPIVPRPSRTAGPARGAGAAPP